MASPAMIRSSLGVISPPHLLRPDTITPVLTVLSDWIMTASAPIFAAASRIFSSIAWTDRSPAGLESLPDC
jgi:hypothetical protein